MKNIITIALKEFSVTLRSSRFVLLFSIFLLMLLLSAYKGAQDYQNELKQYNEIVRNVQSGDTTEVPKPSVLNALTNLVEGISLIGAIIGIVVSFDAISGERERRTLGFLLTQPIYRDTIINGKLLGFTLLVLTVILISSLFAFGLILSITGTYPHEGDIIRTIVFLSSSSLYILTFVVIGIFFSILLKNSVNSLLASITVFVVSAVLISSMGQAIASIVAPIPMFTFGSGGKDIENAWKSNQEVIEKISYISPTENFKTINQVVLNPYFERSEDQGFGKQIEHSITQSLNMVWSNIIAILVTLITFFIASYILFLKQDIN